MDNYEKVRFSESSQIEIPDELKSKEILNGLDDIVGVYGFFACKGDENICFYIGKSVTVFGRLFKASDGHIYQYLRYLDTDNKGWLEKLVPCKINEYLNAGYKIKVEILEIVNYSDSEYSRAAHRLALAELKQIVDYQEQGQCLEQQPEGANDYNYWLEHYSISEQK